MFRNVNLTNLQNFLQKNLRTDRARETIFRVSRDANFENLLTWHQPWYHRRGFDVPAGLPKKLWIRPDML